MKDRNMKAELRPAVQREYEKNFENEKEAFVLLGLIDSEFQSDPQSVACFDLRVVERVKRCVEARKRFDAMRLI